MAGQTPPSPNKRRKLDPPVSAQFHSSNRPDALAAVSAISALAARRRLAASTAGDGSPTPTAEASKSAPSSPNPFSPLQSLQKRGQPSSAKKPGTKAISGRSTPSSHDETQIASCVSSSLLQTPLLATTSDVSLYSTLSETGLSKSSLRPITYSSFSLSKHNHRVGDDGVLTLELDGNERFLLAGNFGIRVLSGQVTVAGASLRPSRRIYWVHAPFCHAIPVLRTVEPSSFEIHNDAEAWNLRNLGRLSPLFRRLWNDNLSTSDKEPSSTFQFLGNSLDVPKGTFVQELSSPPKWNEKLASLAELLSENTSLSVVVCGPKSAGKSTFSRLLTNRLLTTVRSDTNDCPQLLTQGVAVLDLDPGQPEYAPPGTISLVHVTEPNLGAPFTHPSLDNDSYKVLRCHSLASVNLASAADLHLECALDLVDYYSRRLKNCPLIINTPGWVLSLGLELLVDIITRIRPSQVIYMSEEGPAETVEALRGVTKNNFNLLPSQPSELKSRTAAQLREMQAMSYFHCRRKQAVNEVLRLSWSPQVLSTMHPVLIGYSGQARGFLGILRYDFQLEPDLIAEAINGMVLAIVTVEDRRAFRELIADHADEAGEGADAELDALISRTPEGIPFIPNPDDLTLDPRFSRTIGLALVRGIDQRKKCLQVLTPMTPRTLEEPERSRRSVVLVHGNFDTPTWSYTEHLYEQASQDDQEDEQGGELETSDDDASDESHSEESRRDPDNRDLAVPWVEALSGNKGRPAGSRVWRVRRDLGRAA
ncbi:hypothetical protein HIM_08900 [Hirsutella minnesotensis 3608]|uniref:Polynucleotide 5'-hydroxyl-kinase GRC3 n=1 Tax=Hirsutella minnesotensis 3608 TaxID=1043627 RepID=A0A0F7ZSP1_9HYPO|nr:hypothetical protein HIM_08900 [Hirsutella minnesotensis 3608]